MHWTYQASIHFETNIKYKNPAYNVWINIEEKKMLKNIASNQYDVPTELIREAARRTISKNWGQKIQTDSLCELRWVAYRIDRSCSFSHRNRYANIVLLKRSEQLFLSLRLCSVIICYDITLLLYIATFFSVISNGNLNKNVVDKILHRELVWFCIHLGDNTFKYHQCWDRQHPLPPRLAL